MINRNRNVARISMSGQYLQLWSQQLEELRRDFKEAIHIENRPELIHAAEQYQAVKTLGDQTRKQLQHAKDRNMPKVATLQEQVSEIEEAENREADSFYALLQPLFLQDIPTELADYQIPLMQCTILSQMLDEQSGAYKRLQEFCNGNPTAHPQLINILLNDPRLMKQMLVGGGAADGNWGQAMKIYMEIFPLIKNDRCYEQHTKLALAVALEHATPIAEFDTPGIKVDPVARFNHFVQAHRNGELDPAFCHFSVWEYRKIVDCNATHEQMQWGRHSLRRYRPSQVTMDSGSRYIEAVESDVGYRDCNWTSSPRTYQQLLSGGGRAGPRAWYGRFICKAHGIPTWGARQQPRHTAVSRWTKDGWVIFFGKTGWKHSSWNDRLGEYFVKETQARAFCANGNKDMEGDEDKFFFGVTIYECMAEAVGEGSTIEAEKFGTCHPDYLWRSIRTARLLSLATKADKTSFRFPEKERLVESQLQNVLRRTDKPEDDSIIEVMKKGIVRIPACAYNDKLTKAVNPMKSFPCEGGGAQICMPDNKSVLAFVIPNHVQEGDYVVKCMVCTMHLKQQLLKVTVNKGRDRVCQVPYTKGEWGVTTGVRVSLGPGSLLKFHRPEFSCFGLTIKEVRLIPC